MARVRLRMKSSLSRVLPGTPNLAQSFSQEMNCVQDCFFVIPQGLTRGAKVQILSPRPMPSPTCNFSNTPNPDPGAAFMGAPDQLLNLTGS
jgi:hypothetical protein